MPWPRRGGGGRPRQAASRTDRSLDSWYLPICGMVRSWPSNSTVIEPVTFWYSWVSFSSSVWRGTFFSRKISTAALVARWSTRYRAAGMSSCSKSSAARLSSSKAAGLILGLTSSMNLVNAPAAAVSLVSQVIEM